MTQDDYDFDAHIDRRGTGSAKWNRYAADVLPMWVADMDFAVAPEIVDAIKRRLEHPVFGYGRASEQLTEQIVADMARNYDWAITVDEIVFLPGVVPGFNMALNAMLEPGGKVLIQTPIYHPILEAPGHWGLERIDLQLHADAEGRYASAPDDLAAAIGRADAFLFCNPHNPTGKVFTRGEVENIAELCLANDTIIIADEVHCELLFDDLRHTPVAALGPEIADRTITLMAASKTYNIAGLKTAFAIIPNRAIRRKYIAAHSGLVDSVNVLGLEATLAAYRDAGAWRAAAIKYLQANRDYLAEAVAERLPGIRMTVPEATFLAWLDCSGLDLSGNPHRFFLEQAAVGFSAGPEFGAEFGNYVRLNFGCRRSLLEDSVARMEAALRALKG